MKYLPIALAAAVSACATQPAPDVHSIGQSQKAPTVVQQCIAQTWANNSGQTVYSQYIIANDSSFDVFPPGQQAPGNAYALVRPAPSSPGTWVGFHGDGANVTSSISQCL